MFGEMAVYHPRDSHWYLPTVGVDPLIHRKGLGSALLTEALNRCDQDHIHSPIIWCLVRRHLRKSQLTRAVGVTP